jgi:hypothetical protein
MTDSCRRDRQRAELAALLAEGALERAADLAHDHLADFPDDAGTRAAVAAALAGSGDDRLAARAAELVVAPAPGG